MLLSAQILISALVTLAVLPGTVASGSRHQQRGLSKVHQQHKPGARDIEVVPSNSTHELEKRQRRVGHFSWYDTETGQAGNCGDFISNSEFVVAKQLGEFSMADCGKQIRIFYQGKTAVATIKDSCPACWPGGFDMSRGLFQFFEWDAHRVGTIDTEWEWVGAEQPPPPPPPPPPSSSTPPPWTPPPTPSSSSVWQAPSPSSAPVASSASLSSSATPSSSANPSARASGSVSGTARPTESATVGNATAGGNWQGLAGVMVKMAFLITDGPATST